MLSSGELSFSKTRKVICWLYIFLNLSCRPQNSDRNLFSDLSGQDSVVVILSTFGLDSIPPDIGKLTDVRNLTITQDSIKGPWIIMPPESAWMRMINSPPFKFLPDEITSLKTLNRLTIGKLNLKELPVDFSDLENLEYLDLSFNKLDISNELPKLKNLYRLNQLIITGNKLDSAELKNWIIERPDLRIIY